MLKSRLFSGCLLSLCVFLVTSVKSTSSNALLLTFDVPEVQIKTGQNDTTINIYIDNYQHVLFGFQFVLRSSRPDLVKFDFSNNGFDTIGTMTSGWEYMEGIDRAFDQSEVWFRCIADLFFIPGTVPGISPQQGGIAIKIPIITTTSPDTTLDFESILSVETPVDFSDPFGYSIGVVTDTIYDTLYFVCANWVGESCTTWQQVFDTTGGYDSIYVDTIRFGYLDTTQVMISDGSLSLEIVNCDWNGSGEVEIGDLLCMVDYMFAWIISPACPLAFCEFDSDNTLTIADLLGLVEYMFGPPPPVSGSVNSTPSPED